MHISIESVGFLSVLGSRGKNKPIKKIHITQKINSNLQNRWLQVILKITLLRIRFIHN